jgi:hypothetical protein
MSALDVARQRHAGLRTRLPQWAGFESAKRMMTTPNQVVAQIAAGRRSLTYTDLSSLSVQEADALVSAYAEYLRRRTPEERLRLYQRDRMTRCERWIWARRYPSEVPIVNDEFEWIVLEGED